VILFEHIWIIFLFHHLLFFQSELFFEG
jgi:hypothetical protein